VVNREAVFNKYAGRCAYCGKELTIKAMQIDHIIPQRNYSVKYNCLILEGREIEYGLNSLGNLNPACASCNNWKGVWSVEKFRQELEAQTERARKYSRNFRMAERYGLIAVEKEKVTFYYESL